MLYFHSNFCNFIFPALAGSYKKPVKLPQNEIDDFDEIQSRRLQQLAKHRKIVTHRCMNSPIRALPRILNIGPVLSKSRS